MEFYHVKVTIVENAILKTLIYADIFDYPLKAWEIHKWTIGLPAGRAGKKLNLKQVEKGLISLVKKRKVNTKSGYYFLKGKDSLVLKRKQRGVISKVYLTQANTILNVFKLIAWIKLVGISGSLAMENATKSDDIDFFIVTSRNRLWISRIILLALCQLFGKRRKRLDTVRNSSGKFCINILLGEDNLAQDNKNIYLAHEVLQMKVLYDKDNTYQKFLEENEWVFKYLPNWKVSNKYYVSSIKYYGKKQNTNFKIPNILINWLEKLVKKLQLNYMGKPKGMEKVTDNALYFHPEDKGEKILKEYNFKLKKFKI